MFTSEKTAIAFTCISEQGNIAINCLPQRKML